MYNREKTEQYSFPSLRYNSDDEKQHLHVYQEL